MSNPTPSNRKYAHLSRLSTQRLEELLTMPIEDEEYAEAIIQVILAREKEHPSGRLPDPDEAWEAFRADEPLLSDVRPAPRRTPRRRKLRRALATAALAACLVVLAAPVALGYSSIVDMIGSWSRDTFWFEPEQLPDDAGTNVGLFDREAREDYESLADALADFDVAEPVLPTWIPKGFRQTKVEAMVFPGLRHIPMFARYESGIRTFFIAVIQHGWSDSLVYQKDSPSVEVYSAGGVDHYLFRSGGHMVAAWYSGTVECYIEGELTARELRTMIDSIYEEK